MAVRAFVAAVVLSLGAAIGGDAAAAEPPGCELGGKFFARSVTPYSTTENLGYTSERQFRGAEVYVPAQPGLTAEWLQRVIAYQVAAGECDFGVRDVAVSVLPAGGGFSVRLSGKNEQAAGTILRHAQQLVK
jgi:hypothetical protein